MDFGQLMPITEKMGTIDHRQRRRRSVMGKAEAGGESNNIEKRITWRAGMRT
jgi:hypothetical protein